MSTAAENVAQKVSTIMAHETANRLASASLIGHPAELGRARENIIREFLEKICPRGFIFDTGFVFDSTSSISRQQDIVIARESYYPTFEVGGVKYWPVESVVACLEVKSNLASKATVQDSLECLRSARALDRTGGGVNYVVNGHTRGEQVQPDRHEHQIFTAVVAANSISSASLLMAVHEWCIQKSRQLWPNLISVASQRSIVYLGTDPRPSVDQFAARGIGVIDNSVEPLLEIARQLLSFLRVVPIVDYQPNSYIPQSLTVTDRRMFEDSLDLTDRPHT